MKWKISDLRTCIHNYIDTRPEMIHALGAPLLRKGAVSALPGETVIIPVNMHDGILLGTGLGNKDFNCSAPHGSGRIYKREDVMNHYTVSSFKAAMNGIYSTCISKNTLDEAPFAYRGMEEMLDVVGETVKVEKILHPLYNFKAG
ncbi:MAG: RtcB family protein [Agathobacter sp.]